ncbi:hypothetical protein C2E23DRAFT_862342 [Lenzites betulinus]|nr:hypothetical protein C2E23DRAFT_862342 [Lenzites betulinus]
MVPGVTAAATPARSTSPPPGTVPAAAALWSGPGIAILVVALRRTPSRSWYEWGARWAMDQARGQFKIVAGDAGDGSRVRRDARRPVYVHLLAIAAQMRMSGQHLVLPAAAATSSGSPIRSAPPRTQNMPGAPALPVPSSSAQDAAAAQQARAQYCDHPTTLSCVQSECEPAGVAAMAGGLPPGAGFARLGHLHAHMRACGSHAEHESCRRCAYDPYAGPVIPTHADVTSGPRGPKSNPADRVRVLYLCDSRSRAGGGGCALRESPRKQRGGGARSRSPIRAEWGGVRGTAASDCCSLRARTVWIVILSVCAAFDRVVDGAPDSEGEGLCVHQARSGGWRGVWVAAT